MNTKKTVFLAIILMNLVIILMSMKNLKAQSSNNETIMAKDGKPIAFYFIKHASLYFTYDGIVFYLDPVSYPHVDYGKLPKADYILITHDHYDHLDTNAIGLIAKPTTEIICNQEVKNKLSKESTVLKNYASVEFTIETVAAVTATMCDENSSMSVDVTNDTLLQNIEIKAFPAYNTTPERAVLFHPKERDNGYLVYIGGSCLYFAGDCEDMPEMETIGEVDIAFLPINQPYTMTVEQAIHAAEMIKPQILFPYHYGNTDLKGLEVLNEKGIKIIVKPM